MESESSSSEFHGSPMVIWVSSRGNFTRGPLMAARCDHSQSLTPDHAALIFFEGFPLVVAGPAFSTADRDALFSFIDRQRRLLMSHWHGDFSTGDVVDALMG